MIAPTDPTVTPTAGDTMPPAPPEPFKLAPVGSGFDVAKSMRWVRQTYGLGTARQLREMATLTLSSCRLSPDEYIRYALFRPSLPMAEKKTFLSVLSAARINRRLSLPGRRFASLMAHKALAGLYLRGAGLPTTPMLALFAPGAPVPGIRHLDDAGALARYLAEEAPLPCFGKPIDGSLAIGGVAFVGRDAGRLLLSDGNSMTAEDFAAAVIRNFPRGYLFQPLLRMHPALQPVCGQAAGSLRITTLMTPRGPEPLYACFKLPGKAAMTDGPSEEKPNGMAAVDLRSGQFLRAQFNTRTNLETMTEALVAPVPLAGIAIPDMARAVELACEAQRLYPTHGTLGIDVIVTEDGPLIGEVNSNPMPVLYQRSADRGILNPEFHARFAETEALMKSRA